MPVHLVSGMAWSAGFALVASWAKAASAVVSNGITARPAAIIRMLSIRETDKRLFDVIGQS
jgi:hypothetical protein